MYVFLCSNNVDPKGKAQPGPKMSASEKFLATPRPSTDGAVDDVGEEDAAVKLAKQQFFSRQKKANCLPKELLYFTHSACFISADR